MRAFATARRSLGLAVATDGAAPLVWPLGCVRGRSHQQITHIVRPSRTSGPLEEGGAVC